MNYYYCSDYGHDDKNTVLRKVVYTETSSLEGL